MNDQLSEHLPRIAILKSKIPWERLPVIFKLHSQVTVVGLLVATFLVSTYGFVDSSDSAIQCYNGKTPLPEEDEDEDEEDECEKHDTNQILNRYCWISSTFTLPKHFNGVAGQDFLYPGIGPFKEADERIYHAYYQWVPFVLFFQALCFLAPFILWKSLVGEKIEILVKNVVGRFSVRDKKTSYDIQQLANYFVQRKKFNSQEHQTWARNFVVCEFLNLINVVGQLFLINVFLGGNFFNYGLEVLSFPSLNPEERVDPMSILFPTMTKCIFHQFGPSGTLEKVDSLCILGLNIINEKIFLLLWFWFILLAFATLIDFLIRLGQWIIPSTRIWFCPWNKNNLNVRLQFGDWLLLDNISKYMEPSNFEELLSNICQGLDEPEKSQSQDPLISDQRAENWC
ncbi:innexin inx2-like isoform X1 [Tigriopus californicus]|uniref:innexin inx2-like isoform X1 n=1 Tax=Tigriopus californicus TaxID=6832 RepID=UPI0027DA7D9D|nr:innexin inx2-like isoform X1 [Tigriopus californicus]